jgi:hypothetical protein
LDDDVGGSIDGSKHVRVRVSYRAVDASEGRYMRRYGTAHRIKDERDQVRPAAESLSTKIREPSFAPPWLLERIHLALSCLSIRLFR